MPEANQNKTQEVYAFGANIKCCLVRMVKKFSPAYWFRSDRHQKAAVLVIGRRGSGKTTFMIDVVQHIRAPKAVVFSATDSMQHAYSKHFNPKFIFPSPDDAVLQRVIDAQKQQTQKNPNFEESGLLIVIDDAGFAKNFFRSKVMAELLMNGRWYGCCVIVGVQDAASIPLALRTQFDLVCARTEPFRIGQDRLYKWFFGQYDTFKDFQKCHKAVTKDFGLMILDNVCADVSDVRQSILWYTVSNTRPKFTFGSKDFAKA